MKLVLDNSKEYAIALEGGGAKGGYEIGVWQALNEAGVRFNAVSGTSVGALNGALFAMGDLDKAIDVWQNMELTNVIAAPEGNEEDLRKIVSGKFELKNVKELAPGMKEVIKNKGFDASPLREWVHDVVDPDLIRKSGVRLFATTVDLTDKKGLVAEVNELEDDQVYDMLLASSYHPTFRMEKLGGKLYADGGFFDSLPVKPLLDAGYRDIIAVHLPTMAYDRKIKMPEDANIYHIQTIEDLGGVLNFDKDQAIWDMKIGYLDAMRTLYGLRGKKYYVDWNLTQKESLDILIDYYTAKGDKVSRLREVCEIKIPAASLTLGQITGDYSDVLLALIEDKALKCNVDRYRIYTDRELVELALNRCEEQELAAAATQNS